ncbi:PAS domain S-box-containing protein [Gramella sp. Hel_I_59]|uniref:PAS domain-containing protein n=1 Tax=Gramella sp. Hel_I_59 TaxID=1249978 RepID=UPI0011522378|nr:PAS domain S-box protein [Gramella sp. Hel_I_59]TQI70609.1 PAS domain S-box-containing protein [Gramella sp. Hel_I_59]
MQNVREHEISLIMQEPHVFEFVQKYGLHGFLIYKPEEPDYIWLNIQILRHLGFAPPSHILKKSKAEEHLKFSNWKELLFKIKNDPGKSGQIRLKTSRGHFRKFSYKVIQLPDGAFIFALEEQKQNVIQQLSDSIAGGISSEEISQMKKRFELKRLFIEQAPSAIAMFDNDLKYIAVSKRWLKDYHIENIDVVGKSHYEIFPEIGEDWKKIHQECLHGSIHSMDEECFVRADGSKNWITWEVRPWYNSENRIGGIIMHTADITEIKNSEAENHRKQELMEKVLESVDVGIVACDAKGNLTLFNQATKNWHGLPAKPVPVEELSKHYGLYNADGDQELKESEIPLIKTLNTGAITNDLMKIRPVSGEEVTVSVNGVQLFDQDGKLDGAVVAMHNINHRLTAEKKLRISEQTFRGSFEHAAIGMAILDVSGNWLSVNKSLCNIIGYTEKELRKLTFQDITHPDDLNNDLNLLEELVAGDREFYHMEKRYFHNNGSIVFIKLAVSLVRDHRGDPLHFVSQITDITKEKIAAEKLRQTLNKLEGIFNASTHVSIISTDSEGRIESFNKGAERMLGYTQTEVSQQLNITSIHVSNELESFSKNLFNDHENYDLPEFLKKISNSKKLKNKDWTYVRKDGTEFPVQLAITSISENDKNMGYLFMAIDITNLKLVQEELSSVMNITQEQNARLKNFAHIVSHNLRSHSSNIGMLLDLSMRDYPELKENEIFRHLNNASENLSETIEHLNEVTLINTAVEENLDAVNLHKSVENIQNSITAIAAKQKVEICNNIERDLHVLGVPAYIDSIFLNFITNAVKYSSSERNSYVKLSATLEENGFVRIDIEDNGLGIDLKKHRRKLFGMYKTFHAHEDSRGIGLFITKNQIEALHGNVQVKSTPGQGTVFSIYLKNYEES